MVSVARVLIALASLAPLVRVEAIRAEVITAAGIAPVRPRPALVAATDAALAGTGLPHLRRDLDTGAVALAWGAGWPAPGSSADPDAAARAARAFLAAHLTALAPGSTLDHFQLVSNQRSARDALRTVGFVQATPSGLRIIGAQLGLVFARDRLVLVTSTAVPQVPSFARTVTGSATRARAAAAAWLGPGTVASTPGPIAVLPLVRTGGAPEFVAVRTVRVERDGRAWDVYVDAADDRPVARAARSYDGIGAVGYDVPVRYPGAERLAVPAALATHLVDGVATTADRDGRVTWPGVTPATVLPGLRGARVRVLPDAGAPSTTLAISPGDVAIWRAATDHDDAYLSAFTHANLAKAYVAAHLTPELAWIDRPLDVYVNEAGACNAFSTGDDLHFFAASEHCQATARVADIVYHELGHSLHAQSIEAGVGALDVATSEGLADYLAASITGDPGVGRGLFYSPSPVRHLDPGVDEIDYAQVVGADDPHAAGLALAQSLWDLRTALRRALGETAGVALTDRIFVRLLASATDPASAYPLALLVDDDDGDLANGTPHRCAIAAAFGVHGLADETLAPPRIVATALGDLTTSVELDVGATLPGCAEPQVTAVVRWAPRGEPMRDLAMAPTPLGPTVTRWSATIPTPPDGTVLRYQLTLAIERDDVVTRWHGPDNRGDDTIEVYVGPVTRLWCDDFEGTPTGWTHGAEPAEFDQWELATPTGAGFDPAAASSGTRVLGTALRDDRGRYVPLTRQWARSPPIDVAGVIGARLQYRRWLTIEDRHFDEASILIDGTPAWRNADGDGAFPHVDRGWRFHDLALGEAADDGAVQLEFALDADRDGELGGWTIDDVCVVVPATTAPDGCSTGGGDLDALPLGLIAVVVCARRRRAADRKMPSR